MTKPLAVFDVDGTQFKSACVEKVVEEAIKQDVFDEAAFRPAQEERRLWQISNNEGVYQSYLYHLVGGFVASIAGVEVAHFESIVQDMVKQQRVRLFGYTQSLARIVKQSHELVAISGSPVMVVEPFLDGLGFDRIIGSTFAQSSGHYTGEAIGVHKQAVLDEIADARGVDIGIGDTVGDLPVLTAARCPIAFNPSRTLRGKAVQNRWYMVTEHKDAVTQFLPTSEGYQPVFDASPTIILDHAGITV